MQFGDTSAGYGWISIVLHWLTAAAIIVLLFAGNSIAVDDPEQRAAALNFHTSVGVSCYLILWARIAWRAYARHPGPGERQGGIFFSIGKWTHYLMLIALGLMLLSGPAMAWAGGSGIVVFDWFEIPALIDVRPGLRAALHAVHRSCAMVIFAGIVLHLGGVYKHTAFNRDGTFMRMIVPSRSKQEQ